MGIFYIDVDNGENPDWQQPSGYPEGMVVTSWDTLFNSATGIITDGLESSTVYILPRNDHENPDISIRAIDCGVIRNYANKEIKIIGIGYPKVYNSIACTITIKTDNCEITGLAVEHPNGNGIHTYADKSFIHHNKFVGDCSEGSDISIDESNAIVEYNDISPEIHGNRIGIIFYNAKNSIARFNTIKNRRQFIFFYTNSEDCRSEKNTFLEQKSLEGYPWVVRFDSTAIRCKSIGDTIDGRNIDLSLGEANPENGTDCEVLEKYAKGIKSSLPFIILGAGILALLFLKNK